MINQQGIELFFFFFCNLYLLVNRNVMNLDKRIELQKATFFRTNMSSLWFGIN